ncbi:MAG: hypothetical protein DU429_07325 [Candidatus Tokpelaia sp.]|nr:MAG: hypothetical protein DU430_08730 [Candidatus Tokpelaia sp.]KAA6205774.1 MAG: hypothetical protein DU429_07325 [Candidatus Tokpelaia sp.]
MAINIMRLSAAAMVPDSVSAPIILTRFQNLQIGHFAARANRRRQGTKNFTAAHFTLAPRRRND